MEDIQAVIAQVENQAAGRFEGCLTMSAERALIDEIERLNKWADGFSDAQLKERRLCEKRIQEIERERDASLQIQRNASAVLDQMREALKAADEAINPPDRGGISLDTWNKRLKTATATIRAALNGNQ